MKFIKQSTVIINGKKPHNIRRKLFFAIILTTIVAILLRYTIMIKISNDKFAKQASDFYRLNAQTVFSIDKIYMYSSANAIENKETRPIWNLNLYQYTDIAIYINNRSEDKLTYENSIKSLYIDNIKFTDVKNGQQSVYFKNINDFGKSIFTKRIEESSTPAVQETLQEQASEGSSEETENNTEGQDENEEEDDEENTQEQVQEEDIVTQRKQIIENLQKEKITDKLEFSILNDGDVDYSKPQLYTDCSNPITLEYVNNNIKENQIISDITNDIIYDGNILRRSGVILSDIACTMSFNITLTNYYNQKFVANVYIDIPLEDTTTGDNIYKGKFVKVLENTNLIKFFRME
ncbi:MAG: hypothetical protein IKG56_04965 [Clostridia bacterium]|nr:hypothetical protein [Clostridia bacterium]